MTRKDRLKINNNGEFETVREPDPEIERETDFDNLLDIEQPSPDEQLTFALQIRCPSTAEDPWRTEAINQLVTAARALGFTVARCALSIPASQLPRPRRRDLAKEAQRIRAESLAYRQTANSLMAKLRSQKRPP